MKTKKFYFNLLLIAFFLFTASAYSQSISGQHGGQQTQSTRTVVPPADNQILAVPSTMNYQAVARNSSGTILANQAIGLRLTIEDGAGGSTLYQERQVPTTNQFGLLTVKLGSGTVLAGTWAGINWSNGNQWLKVDMDPTGGSSYTAMGESEMLSVPFANFAAATGAVSGTTNNVSKFTSPNTIGNARITDDGTYIRFGTTTGNQIYDFGADNYCDINIHNNGAGEAYFYADRLASTDPGGMAIGSAGTVKWLVGGYATDDFSFLNAPLGTAAMTILNSNNNIGIGTAAPTHRLQVSDATIFGTTVWGENTYAGTNDGIGVYGRSVNAPYYGYGVYGEGGYIGMYGWGNGTSNTNTTYGVYGFAGGSAGTRIGVYGTASGGVRNYGGWFDAQTHVSFTSVGSDGYYTEGANLQLQSLTGSSYIPGIGFYLDDYNAGGIIAMSPNNGLLVMDTAGYSTYLAVYASAFTVSSDRSLKKDINDITNKDYDSYMNQIRNIEPITYLYNDETASNESVNNGKNRAAAHVGFTAQSLPSAVQMAIPTSTKVHPEMKLGYNLSDMAGLTLVGVKALDAKIASQQAEIDALKAAIQKLTNNK